MPMTSSDLRKFGFLQGVTDARFSSHRLDFPFLFSRSVDGAVLWRCVANIDCGFDELPCLIFWGVRSICSCLRYDC